MAYPHYRFGTDEVELIPADILTTIPHEKRNIPETEAHIKSIVAFLQRRIAADLDEIWCQRSFRSRFPLIYRANDGHPVLYWLHEECWSSSKIHQAVRKIMNAWLNKYGYVLRHRGTLPDGEGLGEGESPIDYLYLELDKKD